jgi:hypothetical protein
MVAMISVTYPGSGGVDEGSKVDKIKIVGGEKRGTRRSARWRKRNQGFSWLAMIVRVKDQRVSVC